MPKVTLDLRQNSTTEIFIDRDVIDVITWSGLNQLDTEYSLTLNEGEENEQTYTVGSGLTIQQSESSILWSLDTSVLGVGRHNGTLISNSKISGVYFKMNINLIIE